ncbi:MAG: enoyl-[acyl-carrier-protein] reductase FabL [Alicyclobacillus macrosporangiidus]|uniref:enoyl-[acyl-carrier-protein] reductase FabL n=1 Tax=Alicyclobacillus macrosporangiidus TaxID=392015 RepID=UPI0026EC01E8|nr:enoyl-[acyl-carrier-protein] reductase FabL [Alicyclobacillus macrosporangiidus]MCL6599424.1 enoyl-[acyl-carrier-protein] reductase FabL [Alicyclobacillus macrosporangiidus]
MNRNRRYEGKVVLVTGSSRGIGRKMALRFAEEGADVVIHYFRNGDQARETAEAARALGADALVVKANLAEAEKVHQLFDEIERHFGRLDVYVHNAASGRNRKAVDLDLKGWEWTVNVNARAFLLGAQRAARLMPDGGAMLALSSLGADRVFPYYTSVGATKAAIESMVRYFAVELAPQRINVNAISAGGVQTGALEHFPDMDKTWRQMEERIPYHRMVTADDVANLALFLCSPEAEMIRGQTIRLDGGLTLITP